jgi:hypothetical protein
MAGEICSHDSKPDNGPQIAETSLFLHLMLFPGAVRKIELLLPYAVRRMLHVVKK